LAGYRSVSEHAAFHRSPLGKRKNASRREGRNVVASPEDLNQWLRQTPGEAAGVHVITPSSDLLKDLRASIAAHKSGKSLLPIQARKGLPPAPAKETGQKEMIA
jgi:hypothetical protein